MYGHWSLDKNLHFQSQKTERLRGERNAKFRARERKNLVALAMKIKKIVVYTNWIYF